MCKEREPFQQEMAMSITSISVFDSSVHLTNAWLKELCEDLDWGEERGRAYDALRAVLHALRDRLSVEEAADLAAQLPMVVRGFYYEGWRPSGKPLRERKKEEFLAHVAREFPPPPFDDTEEIVRAVFRLLEHRITGGEISDIKSSLPAQIRELWEQPRG
jgi:uncharacterized protein (DUF2267 family)